ncbi:2-amino-4-hydroxy-6-hydroxymethyldihydropteridine diphosphokinase [Sulfurivermis fontis]|jgi:2-amino-4-hydroxy-6-hydroxymethyldihydropteridine diphosphokinase|uniref:2-amino-4-hydroxy-6- hydroxymethyldihydropteridine diphosphokinase n=1 Tax=Sulfurivermis fontis TaxID=1972068 RepID=UPI000FD99076|nr:2-amino-4-hydroxy-6-hydroxymethyldihydropteridine diphosphokinase [Sulfurivermis fontis]
MARVYVSIGSNIEREQNIRAGVADLKARFGTLLLSSVYESEAVGFAGDSFYNLVAGFDTALTPQQVAAELRAIEEAHGRVRNGPRFSSRTLDIDLLLYDDLVLHQGKLEIPRDEITKNAFVLWPLAEIAPQLEHPQLGVTYGVLWDSFDKQSQPLWPVEFSF